MYIIFMITSRGKEQEAYKCKDIRGHYVWGIILG